MYQSLSLSYSRVIALFFALLLAACGGGAGAGDGVPTFEVDPTLQPAVGDIEFIDEPGVRPVSCIVDDEGNQADFVEDEVIARVEDREELSELAARLNGTVLFEVDPNEPGLLEEHAPIFALLRVDAPDATAEELSELSVGRAEGAGHLRLCSQRALNLLAAIARESENEGIALAANFLARSDALGDRVATESSAPTGTLPAFGAGYSSNAFDLPYMNRGSEQDIGTAEAARMVHEVVGEATGRNRVDLMIIDGGFLRLDDYPDAEIIPRGRFSRANPMNTCSDGSDCPWHGTGVASAALGRFNDGIGAAGSAGPARLDGDTEDRTSFVNPIFVQTPRPNFWDIVEFIFRRVPEVFARYPDIANLSFSADVPAGACLLGACTALDELGRWIERAGILVFASAGNDGVDVDAERCGPLGLVCFERNYRIPCEMPGVICVGGLANDRDIRHANSAWGSKQHGSDTGSVDIYAPYGVWVHDTPVRGAGLVPPTTRAEYVTGTSVASPFTAGIAALIKAVSPRFGRDEIWRVMKETAHTKRAGASVNRWVNAFSAVKRALGGAVPFAQIEQPTDGGRFSIGGSVPLSCDVDDDDGMDGVTVRWSSDLDGTVGGASSFTSATRLREGVHQITCTVTDGLFSVSDTVEISVGNDAPTVEITAPVAGAELFAGATIFARAHAVDVNGNLDDVYWQLFNLLSLPTGWTATGADVTIPRDHLAPGRYTLVATAYDTDGERAQHTVMLTIRPPNGGPSIDSLDVNPLIVHEYDSGDVLFTDSCPVDVSGDRHIDHSDLCRGIHLRANVSDSSSAARYEWTIRDDGGVVDTYDTTVPSLVHYFSVGQYDVEVVAVDSRGVAGNAAATGIHVTTLF